MAFVGTRRALLSGGGQPTLNIWKAAKERVLSGTGRGSIGFIGDSTMMGFGASGVPGGSANALINSRANSMPVVVADKLAAGGIAARTSSIFGDNNATAANLVSYDPRVAPLTTGWLASNDAASSGYTTINQTGANTTYFSITFPENCDSCTLQWVQGTGGGGTFTVNVDGGAALATVATTGTSGVVGSTTVTFTAGTNHTINVQRASGGAVRFYSIRAWLSTGYDISCHNIGVSGAKVDFLNTTVYASKLAQLQQVGCDLWVIMLGINDVFAGTSMASFNSNYQNIITACKQTGDVVLMTFYPASSSTAQQPAYIAAINALADYNKLFVVNTNAFFGTWAAANALGWMYDGTHPNQTGYDEGSELLTQFLLSA